MVTFLHPQTGAPITMRDDLPAVRILRIAGWAEAPPKTRKRPVRKATAKEQTSDRAG